MRCNGCRCPGGCCDLVLGIWGCIFNVMMTVAKDKVRRLVTIKKCDWLVFQRLADERRLSLSQWMYEACLEKSERDLASGAGLGRKIDRVSAEIQKKSEKN